jgi:hypothetical protein
VRESDAPGNRGWHNAIAGPQGQVFSVWLDHREMADHQMGAAPAHAHTGGETTDGTAMAQKSKLFIGALEGPVAPHPVTGGVCYCCKTAIAAAGNDVYAAWRHVYPGNLRDIAFSASKDGGRTFSPPVRVSEDRWTLDGCPDDGPAMSVDASRTIHITWPTLVTDPNTGEPTIAIFYATSRDGRSFGARQRLPTEAVAHHPQIVLAADGTPTVAWDESGTGMRRIVVATGPAFRRVVVTPESGGVYPSLTRSEATIVAAWTASRPGGSVVRVERLDAR